MVGGYAILEARSPEEALAGARRVADIHIEHDVLRLIFLTCHPALPPESRAALTFRLVAGLITQEIARAFMIKDSTVGQRISRAKKPLVGKDLARRRAGSVWCG